MRVKLYKTILSNEGLPTLVKEDSCNYTCNRFDTSGAIVQMMRDVYQIHLQTEEFVYELCFTTKMKPIGIFEISHGNICGSIAEPREIFQKALICGGANIVIVHNHPSGDSMPSEIDCKAVKRLKAAGELIGVNLTDSIIVGDGEYYSFLEKHWCEKI